MINMDKKERYEKIIELLPSVIDEKCTKIGNLANISALLNEGMEDINWVGFYLVNGNNLYLGPFQGKSAHLIIEYGKGMCGTAWRENKTQVIKNVHDEPNHICCDSCSNSEIVVPIILNNEFYGVLDIDSPSLARFDSVDKEYLEKIVAIFSKFIKGSK